MRSTFLSLGVVVVAASSPPTLAQTAPPDAVPPAAVTAPALVEPGAAAPAATTTPTADSPLSVAVLDLKASGDVEGIAKALTTLVTAEVGAHEGYRAVSRNDLKSLLAHQGDQRLLGCDEPQCLADIGKLAQAQRVISGSVERAADAAVVFSLVLVDPEGPTILERVAWTWRSDVDDMVDLARPIVDKLVLGKRADALAGVVDVVAPPGAVVFVDENERGAAPIAPVRGLPLGVHRVEVRKPGFLPFGVDVAVAHGETAVVQADLVDETSVQPVWARWYVWGSALAGVVIIGGTAAAIGTYQYLSTPSKLVVGGPQ